MRNIQTKSTIPYGIILTVFCLFMALFGIFHATRVQADSSIQSDGQRLISVHDQGETRGILTSATTLREAFKEAGIATDPNDKIEPSIDSPLVATQYDVNIYRARPVTIVDGPVRMKIMTPYQTPKQIASHADVVLQDEDTTEMVANTDMVSQGVGMQLTIERATAFTLMMYGKKIDAYTQASTVGEMMKQKDITLGPDDVLSTDKSTPITAGMTVELWRNGKQTVTEEQAIAFPVEQIQDADQPVGYKKVTTPGENGIKNVSYAVEMKNGQEISRTEIQSVVTKEPKQQVEVVGAKFNYTGGPLSEAQITALGKCESGMTATRNSGNGFYGAFQFMPGTWRNVAPAPYNTVMPHEAPLDAQKQAVQTLLSRSSIYTQFPGCAKKMQASGIL